MTTETGPSQGATLDDGAGAQAAFPYEDDRRRAGFPTLGHTQKLFGFMFDWHQSCVMLCKRCGEMLYANDFLQNCPFCWAPGSMQIFERTVPVMAKILTVINSRNLPSAPRRRSARAMSTEKPFRTVHFSKVS